MTGLSLGIEFDQETIDKLDDLINKVNTLNNALEKLQSNEVIRYFNNITINTSTFMGDEQDAREFALLISKYINDEDVRRQRK
jgi:hypothetical protein